MAERRSAYVEQNKISKNVYHFISANTNIGK